MIQTRRQFGFTLVELVVAVAIMAAAMTATGWIFSMGIEAYRMSMATSEIMSSVRAITDELNSDFAGLRKDSPVAVWIYRVNVANGIRADRIWFTANEDFQAVKTYKKTLAADSRQRDWPVFGNIAVITYGLAERYKSGNKPGLACPEEPLAYDGDPMAGGGFYPGANPNREPMKNYKIGPRKVLARRQTIFVPVASDFKDPCATPNDPNFRAREYMKASFYQWWQNYRNAFSMGQINTLTQISGVDVNDGNQVPLVLARGVEDFSIEILDCNNAFDPNGHIRWVDPAAIPDVFYAQVRQNGIQWFDLSNGQKFNGYPLAIKFGFTLYSKTLIKGRPLVKRFTHIAWLRDE